MSWLLLRLVISMHGLNMISIIDLQIRKRKWVWLDHALWKPSDDIARQALQWNPQGKQGRGRPRNTRCRMALEEAKGLKKTWAEIKTDTKHRVRCRILVEALCSAAEWWDAIYIYIYIYIYILFNLTQRKCYRFIHISFVKTNLWWQKLSSNNRISVGYKKLVQR